MTTINLLHTTKHDRYFKEKELVGVREQKPKLNLAGLSRAQQLAHLAHQSAQAFYGSPFYADAYRWKVIEALLKLFFQSKRKVTNRDLLEAGHILGFNLEKEVRTLGVSFGFSRQYRQSCKAIGVTSNEVDLVDSVETRMERIANDYSALKYALRHKLIPGWMGRIIREDMDARKEYLSKRQPSDSVGVGPSF